MQVAQTNGRNSRPARAFRQCVPGAFVAALMFAFLSPPQAVANERAVVLDMNGVIGPAIADYVTREIEAVRKSETRLIVLRMNTPGGLDTSMRTIVGAILASPVAVATFVAPNGARAASAGTYIAYASAVVAMAPGTNIGAATPVQLGGNPFFPGSKPEEKGKAGEPE